ncbi:MAG: ABC transporter ATP-binding protein [Anaerolineales bacterium]|nr:ABC transporter ATP-binding protein [Anaerolineales bacterium]
MAILEVRDLASGYGEVQILWGATLSMEKGQLTSLVGANGAGKTTLLKTVMGVVKPREGSVWFDGRNVSSLSAHKKAEIGLVLVPEGRQLFTDMTIEENLEMGAAPKRAKSKFNANLERVYVMFPRLKERRLQRAGTLSGGEQQMLAVARGLMSDPIVLMVDEMSLGLAPVLVLELFKILRQLKDEGLTLLLVEQNVQMALAVSDYAYVLSHGKVDLHGHSKDLVHDDHVRSAYLGM